MDTFNKFTFAYAFLAVQLAFVGLEIVIVELMGVFATKRRMDTISEHWWVWQETNPIIARSLLAVYVLFSIWLVLHLGISHRGGKSGL